MVAHNAKEQFYYMFNQKIIEEQEVIDIVKSQGEASGFFELCKVYADVGLNASKDIVENSCNIQSLFYDEDINTAVKETIQFIHRNNVEDVDALFTVIQKMIGSAVEWDDTRRRSLQIFQEGSMSDIRLGKYYDFTNLPNNIWQDIKKEIISR